MRQHSTHSKIRWTRFHLALPLVAALCGPAGQAQTIWLEEFDGGHSTTGFWIDSVNVTDCRWEYAPDSVGPEDFSVDFSGYWPAGPGFDSSFVFLDSDACGGTSVVVDSYLYTAPFDASPVGDYTLHFTHQFRARLASFCSIQVSGDGGGTWDEVAHYTGTDAGYPNPAVQESVDITTETAGSPSAQIRFQFNAGWDWWWALDSISVDYFSTIGMEEYTQAPRVRVFPNPAVDRVQVQYSGDDATAVRITDMTGRTVLEQDLLPSLNVEQLTSGSYLVQVIDATGRPLARTMMVRR